MITSISNSLGFGSGIDVNQLVRDLSTASRQPKIDANTARSQKVQAGISALAQARSDLESFSTSLTGVVTQGTLQTKPSLSDETVASASVAPGIQLGNFAADLEVIKLAKAQSAYSGFIASETAAIGQGTLTLSVNGQDFPLVIDSGNDSLTGLAAAINASASGVKASIITDTGGKRIVIKGETGLAKAFTITSQVGSDPGLDQFTTAVLTPAQAAQDAEFTLDGLAYTRPSNSFSDAINGVTLTLKKAAPGTTVAIGITRPTQAIKDTLADFVSVFNELKRDVGAARTAINGDQGLRSIDTQLSRLIGQSVTSHPTLNRMSDIGISTNRDGSIAFNEAKFNEAYAKDPDAVEALFSPKRDATHTETSDPGIAGAFKQLTTASTGAAGALASLKSRLEKEAAAIGKDRERIEARETAYSARLTRQFGAMDARIGAIKATQSYLEQQIKMWTNEN
jgi:flagellar hook-associated protein 2